MNTNPTPPDPSAEANGKVPPPEVSAALPVEKRTSAWAQVARYSAIGMTIPSHVVAGWLIGTLLDKAFSTNYLYIVFLLIGVVSGFIEMIRLASRNPD